MTAITPRARHSRIAAGLFLLSTAAGAAATAVAAGPAAAAPASPASPAHAVHFADQAPNPTAAPGNTVWD